MNRELFPSNEDSPSGADEPVAREEQFYKPKQHADRKGLPLTERIRLSCKDVVDAAFRRELPLQSETSYFILANVLDFYMTYLLTQNGAIESNPIADFFLKNWGYLGMLYFKLASVVMITLLAQAIARRSLSHARFVLIAGTVIVGLVVIYSAWLLSNRF